MHSGPLLYWVIIFCTWTIVRVFLPSTEILEELILKPIVWLGPLLLFWNRIPMTTKLVFSGSFRKIRPVFQTLIVPGVGTLLYALFLNIMKFHFSDLTVQTLLLILLTNSTTALIEEVVFRGILYNWLRANTSEIASFLLVQLLFFAIHIPILLMQSASLPAGILHSLFILIMGAVYTLIYTRTRSLPASILSHAVWNILGAVVL